MLKPAAKSGNLRLESPFFYFLCVDRELHQVLMGRASLQNGQIDLNFCLMGHTHQKMANAA